MSRSDDTSNEDIDNNDVDENLIGDNFSLDSTETIDDDDSGIVRFMQLDREENIEIPALDNKGLAEVMSSPPDEMLAQDDAGVVIKDQADMLENINPEFHKLSLCNGHKQAQAEAQGKWSPIQKIQLSVEATCKVNSADDCSLLTISVKPSICEPNILHGSNTEFDSSGYMADVSRPVSLLSSSPTQLNLPPPYNINRTSFISSSSGSSALESAAVLNRKLLERLPPVGSISMKRIHYLTEKWKNSNVIYVILDYIDKILTPGDDIKILVSNDNNNILTSNNEEQIIAPNISNVSSFIHNDDIRIDNMGLVEEKPRKRLSSEPLLGPPSPKKVKLDNSKSLEIKYLVGKEVFCQGHNSRYYFYSRVTKVLDPVYIEVVFSDGSTRVVTKEHVIADFSLIVGHQVMFHTGLPSQLPSTGIVTKMVHSEKSVRFVIASDEGDETVSADSVHFSDIQAQEIFGSIAIVPQLITPEIEQEQPGTSGIQKMFQIHPSAVNTWDSDDSSLTQGCESDGHIHGCDVESNVPLMANFKLKTKPKVTASKEDEVLGPFHVKGTWFSGYNFLITCFPHVNEPENEIDTDSEDFQFSSMPFLKERLVSQIKGAGGTFFERFEDIPVQDHLKTILISNRPCLTQTYLKCVAANIPVVVHDWIVHCTTQKKFLGLQELPSGWSVEWRKFVERYERVSTRPLEGCAIQFADHSNKRFYKFWGNICRMLGANTDYYKQVFKSADLIVAEDGCFSRVLEEAEFFKVPVVTYSWIVQTVIHGQYREIDGHKSFCSVSEESDEV